MLRTVGSATKKDRGISVSDDISVREDNVVEVPVWTLAAHEADVPLIGNQSTMTAARLDELRTVLATLADTPIATLEAHPMPADIDVSHGLLLSGASPLAQSLRQVAGQLPAQLSRSGGETLYRMVLPAKVAAQLGAGLLKQMPSKAGGVHGALMGKTGIVAQARFVPVGGAAAGGLTGVAALTIAAPLIVGAVAACASIHAEQQRQQAIQRITKLLEKLHQDRIDDERNKLDGCKSSVTKATAILLDRGLIGEALGLGPAVNNIDTAVAAAARRVKRWQESLDKLPGSQVEMNKFNALFPGLHNPHGEFHAHLELARAAIALKRRVIVLQAVEQAQLNPENTFERFVEVLQHDLREIDELDTQIDSILRRLSQIELDRSHGVRDFVFSSAEVDTLLKASRRLRTLGDSVSDGRGRGDVAIEMVQKADGSVTVFPALPTAS